jgi:hypothetical protein
VISALTRAPRWPCSTATARAPVPWVCGLADFDQMTVGIADVTTDLVLVLFGRRQEVRTLGAPFGVDGLDVFDPDIEEAADPERELARKHSRRDAQSGPIDATRLLDSRTARRLAGAEPRAIGFRSKSNWGSAPCFRRATSTRPAPASPVRAACRELGADGRAHPPSNRRSTALPQARRAVAFSGLSRAPVPRTGPGRTASRQAPALRPAPTLICAA